MINIYLIVKKASLLTKIQSFLPLSSLWKKACPPFEKPEFPFPVILEKLKLWKVYKRTYRQTTETDEKRLLLSFKLRWANKTRNGRFVFALLCITQIKTTRSCEELDSTFKNPNYVNNRQYRWYLHKAQLWTMLKMVFIHFLTYW